MVRSKWAKVLVLIVVTLMALSLPLAGCSKDDPPADQSGDDAAGGSTDDSSGSTGDDSGDDASTWAVYAFAPGQHVKYTITVTSGEEQTNGWFSLDFADAGGGNLTVNYAGEFGAPFSGSFTTTSGKLGEDLIAGAADNPMALMCMIPLFATDWDLYLGSAEFYVGFVWSWSVPDMEARIEMTGTETYAGIEGYVGNWTATNQGVTSNATWCVSPSFPMALHSQLEVEGEGFEYTLVEASGF